MNSLGVRLDSEDEYLCDPTFCMALAKKQSGDLDSVFVVVGGVRYRLHRYLLGVSDPTIYIDHINGDVLDNRRANLRLASNARNQMNARRHRDKLSDLPKGVTLAKCNPGRPYQVRISVLGVRYQIGYFESVVAAESAYLKAAEYLHGEFAYHISRQGGRTKNARA